MNRLTQKLLIQSCLKVILCLGLYTTIQQAYTCLFGNEVNKIVNLDYQRIHISFISFFFLLYLMLLLVCQNNKTLSSIVQRYMPWCFFGILERQHNYTLYIVIWCILSNKCIFSHFPYSELLWK